MFVVCTKLLKGQRVNVESPKELLRKNNRRLLNTYYVYIFTTMRLLLFFEQTQKIHV